MIQSITDFQSPFFIGVAGTGMSALAQYLQGIGKKVSGSDRQFQKGTINENQQKLEAEGIQCFPQDGSGITSKTDLIVVSTAIEDTVEEVVKAKQLGIPIIRRSALLAMIAESKKTIAVGGTSGKSTTVAMIYEILSYAGLEPGIISGAGLTRLIKQGKIGNAAVGKGEWLVIEADESDGSIVQYKPELGILLNIDKDHQEINQLIDLFDTFKKNTRGFFVVNQSHPLAQSLSAQPQWNFSVNENDDAAYHTQDFKQEGFSSSFTINGIPFFINAPGRHNMENALAAATVANLIGVSLQDASEALKNYEGIYRRHQVLGNKKGIWVVDDYAHNPAKCAAAIEACQAASSKVIAWFQPHGYGPTKFLKNDFIDEFAKVLRPDDEIWMSEIYYAGGTAVKDISAKDLIDVLAQRGCKAYFVEDRNKFLKAMRPHLKEGSVLLLMGARDPGLEFFTQSVWDQL
jgi:UDP-N-acetylmuramate--alanine ligase